MSSGGRGSREEDKGRSLIAPPMDPRSPYSDMVAERGYSDEKEGQGNHDSAAWGERENDDESYSHISTWVWKGDGGWSNGADASAGPSTCAARHRPVHYLQGCVCYT